MSQRLNAVVRKFRSPFLHRRRGEDAIGRTAKDVVELKDAVNGLRSAIEHLQTRVLVSAYAPIDRHIALVTSFRNDALFDESYAEWRTRRLQKLLQLYGAGFFRGKTVIELGAGLCEVGAFLAELGAQVTCVEGRQEQADFARLKHRKQANLSIECCDLEEDFSALGSFDVMIHWGLLYHLKNIDAHLSRCFAMSGDICLESVVCDRLDPYAISFLPGRTEIIEESLRGMGCRPSPAYIERLASEAGFDVERHFSRDLNTSDGRFVYDWTHRDDGDLGGEFRMRRLWRFIRRARET